MSPSDKVAKSITTVGDFIVSVVVKELWASQILRGGCFQEDTAEEVKRLAPCLADDILCAVAALIPSAAEVIHTTLLPDLDSYPHSASDVDGLCVEQRKLLFDSLEVILDAFNDPGGHGRDAQGIHHHYALPPSGLACISAQISSVLEHLHLLRPQLAVATGSLLPGLHSETKIPHKQALMAELQHCRRHLMDHEREQATMRRMAEAAVTRGKQDAEKQVSRLLHVNKTLEQKHKAQFDENRRINQRCNNLEQRAQHYERVAEEKTRVNKQLQDEVSKVTQRQEDNLTREKEYGKRVVHLHIDHLNRLNGDHQRIRKMSAMLADGPEAEQAAQELLTGTSSLISTTQETISAKLEEDLNTMFDTRHRELERKLTFHENKLADTRVSMHQDHQDVLKVCKRALERPGTHAAAVQTELTLLKDDKGLSRKTTQFKLPPPVRAGKTDSVELKSPEESGGDGQPVTARRSLAVTATMTTTGPIPVTARRSSNESETKRAKPNLRRMQTTVGLGAPGASARGSLMLHKKAAPLGPGGSRGGLDFDDDEGPNLDADDHADVSTTAGRSVELSPTAHASWSDNEA